MKNYLYPPPPYLPSSLHYYPVKAQKRIVIIHIKTYPLNGMTRPQVWYLQLRKISNIFQSKPTPMDCSAEIAR